MDGRGEYLVTAAPVIAALDWSNSTMVNNASRLGVSVGAATMTTIAKTIGAGRM